ncbi:MAG: hypothetical protein D6730_06860, partial [Bacteroidetes bacterium]
YDACAAYVPFYELQDTNAHSLSVACACQDTAIDLSARLRPYTQVRQLVFRCEARHFDQIPRMPAVTHLTSEVITPNILAFPNLEVYHNKTYLEQPVPNQILFLPKLREVVLFNATRFSSLLGTKPLEVFKMSFQNTASHRIQLPPNLHTLKNLTALNIQDIDLALFSNFEHLQSLQSLRLSRVLWARIPQTPGQWPRLKSLELSEVRLRGQIPDIFEHLDSLQRVYISETNVSARSFIHICKAPNLKALTLSFCELETIPDEIGQLSNLHTLIITTEQHSIANTLTLPASAANLTSLKSVFLSTNARQFPPALLKLSNTLESIAIKDEIGSIPPEIGNFSRLKVLKLNNCGLSSLPPEIQQLAGTLEELHLAGNQFDQPSRQQIARWLPGTAIFF